VFALLEILRVQEMPHVHVLRGVRCLTLRRLFVIVKLCPVFWILGKTLSMDGFLGGAAPRAKPQFS